MRWSDLFDYPLGTVFVDCMSDPWMLHSFTLTGPNLVAPDTQPQPAEAVFRNYGPLEIAYVPNERGLW